MDKKPRKQPKKITASYLENAALFYLQRYATSARNLKNVLIRKIDRSCAFHKTPPQEFYAAVDALIERYQASGLLNDPLFAASRAASLRRQGQSRRTIEARLRQKGLAKDVIALALQEVDEERYGEGGDEGDGDAELDAARAFARRKKLGLGKRELRKEMAAMARAGFSYETAAKALSFREDDIT
jgi:regulatory protein